MRTRMVMDKRLARMRAKLAADRALVDRALVHHRDDALEREALAEMGIDPLAGDDVGCK